MANGNDWRRNLLSHVMPTSRSCREQRSRCTDGRGDLPLRPGAGGYQLVGVAGSSGKSSCCHWTTVSGSIGRSHISVPDPALVVEV
jgi:hypothetical protein